MSFFGGAVVFGVTAYVISADKKYLVGGDLFVNVC